VHTIKGRDVGKSSSENGKEDAEDLKGVKVAILNQRAIRIWDWVIKASIPIVIAAVGMILQHEIRIAHIETTRFSEKDGASLERRVMEALPPRWLIQLIDELKLNQKELGTRQLAILDRITRVEEKLIKERK